MSGRTLPAAIVLCVFALVPGGLNASPVAWVLSTKGFGPLRVGMTVTELASKGVRIIEDPYPLPACRIVTLAKHPGVRVMIVDSKVIRVTVTDQDIRTDRGIHIGSTETEVRGAYRAIEREPHQFSTEPAVYLTWWDIPGKRGVRFETNSARRVNMIHVGGDGIRLTEGCV